MELGVARFAIDSGTAIHLASASVEVSPEHKLHVPTLWRSETLTALYEARALAAPSPDNEKALSAGPFLYRGAEI